MKSQPLIALVGESNQAPKEPNVILGEQAHPQDEEEW